MNVWIVIAAYNEENSISNVVSGLKKGGYSNVVVVDDGSKDNTYDVAKKVAHVLKHKVNQGQGAALRTGIQYALKQGADAVVTFDADGQHRVEDLPLMLKPVLNGEVDVTLGSRFLGKKSDIPLFRKFVLKVGTIVVGLLYGIWLTDTHNGFRVFSRAAAEKIQITCPRMEHASEILWEIKRKKLSYREIPIVINYTEYSMKRGQSSWNSVKIFWRMLKHRFGI